MVHFSKLNFSGFKSFADSAEVEIKAGLTGIVGPNGCGKSNLVEALRWVMGETSAKRMRGAGMEDVIFAGTSNRTSKNRAEVVLTLDNSDKSAPAPFQNFDTLEVSRLIERDQGSVFRINGKAVRARDVQTLFADISIGANSPALVSQGRVSAIINAKPSERRKVLEESAGVAGLYARRHEAEIRLKAAETNLVRLDDIMGGASTRYASLQKQIRQANRYKNVSQSIRELEGLIFYLEWRTAKEMQTSLKQRFDEVEGIIREVMVKVTQLTTKQTETASTLPELRKEDATLAAQLQSLLIERRSTEDALKRIDADLENARQSLVQIDEDEIFEKENLTAMQTTLSLRKVELEGFDSNEQALKTLEEKQAELSLLKADIAALEQKLNTARQQAAQSSAALETAQSRFNEYTQKLTQITDQMADSKQKLAALADQDTRPAIAVLEQAITGLKADKTKLEAEKQRLTDALDKTRQAQNTAQQAWHESNTKKEKILSEINILKDILKVETKETAISVIESIKPKTGYEIALAKAMGDTLLAALEDPEANQYWQMVSYTPQDLPELSAIMEPLSSKVDAPEALTICLSQIGVVIDELPVETILKALKPGQMAVTKSGDVYRWDGYIITSRSQSATAKHFEQKSQLETLTKELKTLETTLEKAANSLCKEKDKSAEITAQLDVVSEQLSETSAELNAKTSEIESLKQESLSKQTDIIRLEERLQNLTQDQTTTEQALEEAKTAIERAKATTQQQDQEKEITALSNDIQTKRAKASETESIINRISYEQETRRNRIDVLNSDIAAIQQRIETTQSRINAFTARRTETTEKIQALEAQPQTLSDKLEDLLSNIASFETTRSATVEKLEIAETAYNEATKSLKLAETALSEAKEQRASITAHLTSCEERLERIQTQVETEGLDDPQTIFNNLDWPEDEALPTADDSRQKLEKLKRERESIGAVNLMAAEEAEAAAQEIDTMTKERGDLVEAIQKLRGAIQKLNKEARERMNEAFNVVNQHFQRLFVQVFDGGQAHLELIESDDILDSGLEIFAQPPGKKLQCLSLLSGGEQTLASIALIFAMFLTNPSPICVLDEIDAPLDDANVDRICTLLEQIAETTQTRFLVITHHRMTMARMDRLYGVTMAERGISQLVSVDLQQSFLDQLAAE
ncbi:MAG: chromosome segregation protein SMC [Micavibrio sp.]|nr:chromosome segregation protein SMC [Micavibrio sp.]